MKLSFITGAFLCTILVIYLADTYYDVNLIESFSWLMINILGAGMACVHAAVWLSRRFLADFVDFFVLTAKKHLELLSLLFQTVIYEWVMNVVPVVYANWIQPLVIIVSEIFAVCGVWGTALILTFGFPYAIYKAIKNVR